MVNCLKSFCTSGTTQWLLQRLTALAMLVYFAPMLWWYLSTGSIDYATWHACYDGLWMHVLAAVCLLSLIIHAAIGFWIVATDYIKCPCVRNVVLALLALYLLGNLFFGMVFIGF